ncbi:hypothetical protein [Parendozoicomonas haliclonae]|uniref:DUF4440 domain-containing protein n=2 Tax=Parendozoicomonas haliclonae TaxID=1960125 RepID=A0A1X7AE19_9GAMM|nr:hypothetical protein [Parendozoicomonas haliclonae]SMA31999.1 hypothetical protein EHSB41UT_00088 [Parendozoicomonas haliclonae]
MPTHNYSIKALLCTVLLFLLSACSQIPDEEAINQQIDAIVSGLNEKDNGKVLERLSPDFQGSHNLDRQNARRLMAGYFLRHKNIDVVLTHRETTVQGSSAITQGAALLAGRDQLLPETGRVVQLTGYWEKNDDEWLLEKLEWK